MWLHLLSANSAVSADQALREACVDFGIDLETALAEKALELRLRSFLRALPNDRLKESQHLDFQRQVFAPQAIPSWLPTVVRSSRGRPLSDDELAALTRSQNDRCALCGCYLNSASQPHVDHRIPIALGGEASGSNLQLLCARCNLGKNKLLGWIMGAPFLAEGRGEPTGKQRYCVLTRAQSRCEVPGCDEHAQTSQLFVVPKVRESSGGRWIFDNLMVVCAEHKSRSEREALANARTAIRRSAIRRAA